MFVVDLVATGALPIAIFLGITAQLANTKLPANLQRVM
jgi:hypothetical protein